MFFRLFARRALTYFAWWLYIANYFEFWYCLCLRTWLNIKGFAQSSLINRCACRINAEFDLRWPFGLFYLNSPVLARVVHAVWAIVSTRVTTLFV